MKITNIENSISYLRNQISFTLYTSKENLELGFSHNLLDSIQKSLLLNFYIDRKIIFVRSGYNTFLGQRCVSDEKCILKLIL